MNVQYRNGKYRARAQIKGVRHTRTFKRRDEALDWLKSIHTRQYKVSEVIKHYQESPAFTQLADTTQQVNSSMLLRWHQTIGHMLIDDVRPRDITLQRATYTKPATGNRAVSVLSSVYQYALEQDMCTQNPCRRIKALRTDNADAGQYLPPGVRQAMIDTAASIDADLHTYLILLINTGARLSEIAKLSHADADIVNMTLTFRQTKNGTTRIIPMPRICAERLKKHRLPPMFSHSKWHRVLKKLNIKCRIHDLRHSYITDMLAKGVDPITVGKLVGHKSIAMTERYYHPDVEQLRRHID